MKPARARRQCGLRILALPVIAGLLVLAAIPARALGPSKQQKKLRREESGFLGDYYRKLRPDPRHRDWLIFIEHRDTFRKSNVFLVDKAQVFLIRKARERDIPQQDLDRLAGDFTTAVRDQLRDGHYTLVDQPGPGVIRLRLAITNVEPNGGAANLAAAGGEAVAAHAVVPVPGVSELVPRIMVGKVSVEGEMVDSQTGDVEMAFMTAKSGRRMFSGLRAFRKWADIDAAFRDWAKNFRQRLDQAHAA